MNKRGQIGESILSMYRTLLVIIISVVVLGMSSIVYSYDINVRDSEAMLMTREISDCVIFEGLVNFSEIKEQDNVFEYCGFEGGEVENFFVSVVIWVESEKRFEFEGGDGGTTWVSDIFRSDSDVDEIERYRPGYFEKSYNVFVLSDGVEKEGSVVLEVVKNAE